MSCCSLMTLALDYTEAHDHKPQPGLQTSHCFERTSGKYTRAMTTYNIPASGRGKERVKGQTLVVTHCPFCGTPTPAAAEVERQSREAKKKREELVP